MREKKYWQLTSDDEKFTQKYFFEIQNKYSALFLGSSEQLIKTLFLLNTGLSFARFSLLNSKCPFHYENIFKISLSLSVLSILSGLTMLILDNYIVKKKTGKIKTNIKKFYKNEIALREVTNIESKNNKCPIIFFSISIFLFILSVSLSLLCYFILF